jgi:hypothetical protein
MVKKTKQVTKTFQMSDGLSLPRCDVLKPGFSNYSKLTDYSLLTYNSLLTDYSLLTYNSLLTDYSLLTDKSLLTDHSLLTQTIGYRLNIAY